MLMSGTSNLPDRPYERSLCDNTASAAESTASRPNQYSAILKYRRYKRQIIVGLRYGHLKPGDLLPTVVEMSAMYGIAPNTIRRALVELDDEGIIRRVRGKGTYIREDALRRLPRRLDALGLVVNETETEPYPALFHGLEQAAENMHCQILLSNSRDDAARQESIILQLLKKRVAGVAIVPCLEHSPPHHIRLLQKNDIPVVCCHRRIEGARAPLIALPFRQVTNIAGRAIVEHGHRNIAILCSGQNSQSKRDYAGGLRDVVHASGGTVRVIGFDAEDKCRHDRKNREREMTAILDRVMAAENRPTALMSTFDSDAELAYLILAQKGLRIPEDISLVSFGGKGRKGAIFHRLTAVTVDGTETGRLAGKLIEEMIDGRRAIDDTEKFVLDVDFHRGETLGPPPLSTPK